MRPGALLVTALALVGAACVGDNSSATTTASPEETAAPATAEQSTTTAPTTSSTSAAERAGSSTTTQPAVLPDSIPEGTVGFIGCSVSQNAVSGYNRILGGDRLWSANAPYGGGSLGRWVRDLDAGRSRYWMGFDEGLAENPDTTVLWFSLCTIRGAPGDNVEVATQILEEARRRLPDAAVYVSAQPAYSDGHICELAGETGPEQMADIAAQLVTLELALPGPIMGPLAESQTADGCHANENGQEFMGRQLMDFFG